MPSRAKFILHILFGAFQVTSRILKFAICFCLSLQSDSREPRNSKFRFESYFCYENGHFSFRDQYFSFNFSIFVPLFRSLFRVLFVVFHIISFSILFRFKIAKIGIIQILCLAKKHF